MTTKKDHYFVEVTDTFGGEANYAWVHRYLVSARSERGAIAKLSRHAGYHMRKAYDGTYRLPGACMVAFIDLADGDEAETHMNVTTI